MEIKLIQTQFIPLSKLDVNKGQVEGIPSNPRRLDDDAFAKLKKSIEERPGMLALRELCVYPHGNKFVVLGGNMRLRAMRELKYKEAPCKVIPEDTPLDELKAFVVVDNSSFGAWDYDALANEWDDLPLQDWGVPAWEGEGEGEKDTNEAQEDDFDEDEQEIPARCKLGDIWQLGDHRLMCGDSTNLETVKVLMGGATADLLLTDPPYNVNYGSRGKKYKEIEQEDGKNYQIGKDDRTIMNDNMDDGVFLEFLHNAMRCASDVMRPGASYYIFHSDSEGSNFREAATEIGKVRECLIWVKNSLVLGRQDYQWRHEPCLYGWKDGGGHNWFNDRSQTTVLEFDRPKKNAEHPTMKPVPLFSYLMKNSTKPGEIVLDLFAGSGTTLVCAEQLGRRCFTMELDPHYCDVVLARWEALTGQSAVKV